jgi:large subunit ribosomal protein L10
MVIRRREEIGKMPTEKKSKKVEELRETFAKSNIVILTDYRGLTTLELTSLRRKLRETGTEYKVVKNTLARLAAAKAGKEALVKSLAGPIAIAFGQGDIIAPVRALTGYINDTKSNLTIKGGFLATKLITAEEVITLATLPPREILLARVLGQMQSPLARLLGSLTAPMRGVIGALQSRIKQLEGN